MLKKFRSFVFLPSSHHETGLKVATFRKLLMLESFYVPFVLGMLRVMFSGCFPKTF